MAECTNAVMHTADIFFSGSDSKLRLCHANNLETYVQSYYFYFLVISTVFSVIGSKREAAPGLFMSCDLLCLVRYSVKSPYGKSAQRAAETPIIQFNKVQKFRKLFFKKWY